MSSLSILRQIRLVSSLLRSVKSPVRSLGCHKRRLHLARTSYCANSGTNRYTERTHTCGQLTIDDVGQEVILCGWLEFRRLHFAILRDGFGSTQVFLDKENAAKLSKWPYESVMKVRGKVRLRPENQRRKESRTGDVEVEAESIELLNPARPKMPIMPRKYHEITEATRLKYRYIDLRHEQMQKNLRLRSRITKAFRDHLTDKLGFCEVETPTLFRRTPGGAKEFPVACHSHAGQYYSLTQSPQQFKQLLMVGAIDRYFQVARCYRDETARPDRQPEFTQVDLEMSFVTEAQLMALLEETVKAVWPTPITSKFPVMSYREAMFFYGTDKPDIRFDCFLEDGKRFLPKIADTLLNAEVLKCVRFDKPENLSPKHITEWNRYSTEEGLRGWSRIIQENPGKLKPLLKNYFDMDEVGKETSSFILAWGEKDKVEKFLGRIRNDLAVTQGFLEGKEKDHAFVWIKDFPLFSRDANGRIQSEHHPFTAPCVEDEEFLTKDPLGVRGQHFDLVLNGCEIGGGSIRVHNAKMQRTILEEILEEDTSQLSHLLEALESGAPPHGGFAFGLDRILAILCGATSIRDVMAFPKTSEGRDLLSGAPIELSDADLHHFHLRQR